MHENLEGAILKQTVKPLAQPIPEVPKYWCPLEIFYLIFQRYDKKFKAAR